MGSVGHCQRVGRRRCGVVAGAVPAGDRPAGIGRGRQADCRAGHILPGVTPSRLRRGGRGVRALPGMRESQGIAIRLHDHAIRRPVRLKITPLGEGQARLIRPIRVHNVDFVVAVAVRVEDYLIPVGGPRRATVPSVVIGQIRLAGPVDIHDIDFRRAVAVTAEYDPLAIGRPGRAEVIRRISRQLFHVAAVSVHDVDIVVPAAITGEDDARTVGRPVRAVLASRNIRQPGLV